MEERYAELICTDIVNCAAMYNINRLWEQPVKRMEMEARLDGIRRTAEIFGYAPILERDETGAITAVHVMHDGKNIKRKEVWCAA